MKMKQPGMLFFIGLSVMFLVARAEAGSLVIPAWSFARGNLSRTPLTGSR